MGTLTKQLIGKEDFDVQVNTNLPEQFSRLTSTGGTIALYKIPDMWAYTGVLRPYDVFTKGAVVDVRAFMDGQSGRPTYDTWYENQTITDVTTVIQAAYTAANNKTLLFGNGTYYIASAVTMPSTVSIVMLNGAIFLKGGTATLTINGPFSAGFHQVFSGFSAGDIIFGGGSVSEIYAEWWLTNAIPGTTDMTTAIQSAHDSIPSTGGHIRGLNTTYLLTDKITFSKGPIWGTGWDTLFSVDSSVGATVDAFYICPTANTEGWVFKEFKINSASGTPGRYGIHIDTTSFTLSHVVFDQIYVGNLGSYGVYGTNPTGNGYWLILFKNCHISNGVYLNRASDDIVFRDCSFNGVNPAVTIENLTGSNTFIMEACTSINEGGLLVYKGTESGGGNPRILYNQIDQVSYVGTYDATITLEGSALNYVTGAIIKGNKIYGATNIKNLIRLNYTYDCDVKENVLYDGTELPIILTANSYRNRIGLNYYYSTGLGVYWGGVDDRGNSNQHNIEPLTLAALPSTGTYDAGKIIWKTDASPGGSFGWICTTKGSYIAGSDTTGDTDGSTAVITGMTDTSWLRIGEFVSVSAGFATTGPYKVIAKTATTITLDTNSNAVQNNITVAGNNPVWTAMPNI